MLYFNRSGKTQSVFRLVYGLDYSVFDSQEGLYLQNNTDVLSGPTSLLYLCVCTQVHNHVYNTASRKMHYIKLHLFGGSFNEPTIQYYNVSVTEKVRNNGKLVRGKPQSSAEKSVPVTRPPPTKNTTWSSLESNPGLRNQRPSTIGFSHATVCECVAFV